MVLKVKVKLSQAKKAWTQYLTIPSAMVQDSQYPFKDKAELYLEVEPKMGILIFSKEKIMVKTTSEGVLITSARNK